MFNKLDQEEIIVTMHGGVELCESYLNKMKEMGGAASFLGEFLEEEITPYFNIIMNIANIQASRLITLEEKIKESTPLIKELKAFSDRRLYYHNSSKKIRGNEQVNKIFDVMERTVEDFEDTNERIISMI